MMVLPNVYCSICVVVGFVAVVAAMGCFIVRALSMGKRTVSSEYDEEAVDETPVVRLHECSRVVDNIGLRKKTHHA